MIKPYPAIAYDALPKLPPRLELETRAVLRACIGARAAVAELKQAGELLPNQAVLLNTIPLLEAQASSEIENVVTTADEIFRFAHGEPGAPADSATREALRYRQALRFGVESLSRRPLSTSTAVGVCRVLLGSEIDIRRVPGTALVNQATGEKVYTPPEGEARLRDLLANWERFMHADAAELDPLIRMAVGHYQFEAIHPFLDGNGRTGRILNLVYLVEQGLLKLPVLNLSRAIIATKSAYYQHLLAVTMEEKWEAWVLYMLKAVEDTARWTTERIHLIRQLQQDTERYVRVTVPGVYSREIVELIFVQPYCRIQNVVDAGIAKRETASTYLKLLAKAGVLIETKVGREKLFINPRLMRVLTRDEPGSLAFPAAPAATPHRA